MVDKRCNGICVTAHDVGLPYYGIVYPHPECELHGYPEEELPDEALPYDIGEEPHSWKDEDESQT